MNLRYLVWILILIFVVESDGEADKILSRQRRFLAFPDGSSFAASICMTVGMIGNPVLEYMSWAVNWGLAYDLPNQTWVRQHKHGFSNPLHVHEMRNRYRRDLYADIELALDSMGFNGRDCIARTLCESSNYLHHRTGNMVEEIIKTIFRFPSFKPHAHMDPDAHPYDKAYSRGRVDPDCYQHYPNCEFSLLDLVLGEYSLEPTKHGPDVPLGFM